MAGLGMVGGCWGVAPVWWWGCSCPLLGRRMLVFSHGLPGWGRTRKLAGGLFCWRVGVSCGCGGGLWRGVVGGAGVAGACPGFVRGVLCAAWFGVDSLRVLARLVVMLRGGFHAGGTERRAGGMTAVRAARTVEGNLVWGGSVLCSRLVLLSTWLWGRVVGGVARRRRRDGSRRGGCLTLPGLGWVHFVSWPVVCLGGGEGVVTPSEQTVTPA